MWAMRKGGKSELNVFGNPTSIDSDELAHKIAQGVGTEMRLVFKEFLDELKKTKLELPTKGRVYDDQTGSEIRMDESIIPIDIAVDIETTNLDGAATEQKVVDKELSKSKSKLAGLFKNRTKE